LKNANIEHKHLLTVDSETQEGIVRQIQVAVVSIQGVQKAPIFQDQLTRNWNQERNCFMFCMRNRTRDC
jgi:hypothetical protein